MRQRSLLTMSSPVDHESFWCMQAGLLHLPRAGGCVPNLGHREGSLPLATNGRSSCVKEQPLHARASGMIQSPAGQCKGAQTVARALLAQAAADGPV